MSEGGVVFAGGIAVSQAKADDLAQQWAEGMRRRFLDRYFPGRNDPRNVEWHRGLHRLLRREPEAVAAALAAESAESLPPEPGEPPSRALSPEQVEALREVYARRDQYDARMAEEHQYEAKRAAGAVAFEEWERQHGRIGLPDGVR